MTDARADVFLAGRQNCVLLHSVVKFPRVAKEEFEKDATSSASFNGIATVTFVLESIALDLVSTSSQPP